MSRSKRKTSPEPATTLFVKNMVCERCIRVVKEELESIGLTVERVLLGEVSVRPENRSIDLKEIRSVLERSGFELIEDRKARIIEEIKNALVTLIHQDHEEYPLTHPYSRYLSIKLGKNYHYLSNLFSSIENITIEKYIILQKIERAKELLKYGEMNLKEIAYKMGYSSVQHLSNQFRKITGLTPTHFRKLKKDMRKPIDKLTS